ncbi:hypothetical protein HD554DRAFT_2175003 [Boletus coccyginus]|nr:hypothetical protein HD554DRAFT_2175003 [Boletus coccyginus]
MSSPYHSEVDVLIISAGPAGLMCANALANARVNVRIVDNRAAQVAAGQADEFSPRTIEVFQVGILVFYFLPLLDGGPCGAMGLQNVFCGKEVKYTWLCRVAP